MSTCGCTDTNPATPVPPNCTAIPAYAEPATPETSCCMACVFDDLEANWVKPVGEATALLPVCDVTRFREDQCVAVVGTNGKGGVYKIESVLTGEIELSIYDGTTYDIGGAGTVQGGRVYLLPVCPLAQSELISLIEGAIPSEFVLAIGATSDTTHGFNLALDGNGDLILQYNQTNFEAQVAIAIGNIGITTDIAAYLNGLGVSLFHPVTNAAEVILFATAAAASGTLDIAADFAEVIPANATHARLLIDFFVSAGHDNGGAVAGDCSQMVGSLEFAGSSQFRLDRGSESVYPTVQSTQGASMRDLGSRAQVALDIPMTAGMIDWEYTRTIWPATGRIEAGNDAEGSVRLLGFLIAL